jgi:hypothetical protein
LVAFSLVAAVVPMQMLLQLLQLQMQMLLQLQTQSKFRAFSDFKTSQWEVFLFVSVAIVSFERLA